MVGVLAFTIVIIGWVGWAIPGAILFTGSTWALGTRTPVRDM